MAVADKPLGSEAQKVAAALEHWITRIMAMVGGDDLMLAEVVAQGQFKWRATFIQAFKGFPVSVDLADKLFYFFEQRHKFVFGGLSPKFVLDKMEVTTPPTQAEIDQAWEVESGSTEAGKRAVYGPDYNPEQIIRQVIDLSKQVH